MYSYTYDKETGGILLNSSPTAFSKEPRPVYAAELDILGFDRYWKYDKQNEIPYMWSEANTYWYRGICVAKLKGGNLFTAPEIIIATDDAQSPAMPEPDGNSLSPIDIKGMVKKNYDFLEIIEQSTVKKIVAIYEKYKEKLDIFHVAFSGGKDSAVLLDLVKKALPKESFVVVFGDTGMEFPDTYEAIEKTQKLCAREEIPFYTAKSHLEPKDSWELFGPPSRILRWCCSVHKSAPQVIKLREITDKNNYVGLAFVGVRKHESVARKNYQPFNFGKKIRGQYDFYPILELTSAEIWLYLFTNNIFINKAYIKGNNRAGCLFCPMSGGNSDYMRCISYPEETQSYINLIKATSNRTFNDKSFSEFMKQGAWGTRGDGRNIAEKVSKYTEKTIDGNLLLIVNNPSSSWQEWIKTLKSTIDYTVSSSKGKYIVEITNKEVKDKPKEIKLLRQVFKKAAFCKSCRTCEANCKHNCLTFKGNHVQITDCRHCLDCHDISNGCLCYDSLKIPHGGKKMRAINSFNDHAPKTEWLASFFEDKDNFLSENTLGPDQNLKFKVFLTDACLIEKGNFSQFARVTELIGWRTNTAQGLILSNLVANNPQFFWYVKNMEIGQIYSPQFITDMLLADNVKDRPAKQITRAFKRISDLPLGTKLNFGHVTEAGGLVRTKCSVPDAKVVLYALFKFAEKCDDYKEFSLSTLLNDTIERDGISPSRIFGLERDEMIPLLTGLSAKYPDFIEASFTHDLEKISLAKNKSSLDVLVLFEGD